MSNKHPSITEHPIVQTVVFRVKNCPRVKGRRSDAVPVEPWKVIVEKRPRGVRFLVHGQSAFGEPRVVVFNSHGYENNQPAPNWLVILWEEVKDELGI